MAQTIDFSMYNSEELDGLLGELETEIANRRENAVRTIAKELQDRLDETGVALSEVLKALKNGSSQTLTGHTEVTKITRSTRMGANGSGGKARYWYRNPGNPSEVWKGKARRPAWLETLLKQGTSLNDIAIPNPEISH